MKLFLGGQGLLFYNASLNAPVAIFGTGASATSKVEATTNVTDGNWHFIVAAHTPNKNKIYVDGVQEGEETASTLSGASGTFSVGSFHTTTWFFNGTIDDVRIYNEALSSAQIQQHYAQGAPAHGIAVNDK